jgi:hypothetical protein
VSYRPYYPVQKVADLRPGKKSCIPGGAQFLIPFKVGPLWLHTLSPTLLPLLEAFLESFFWKASQLLRHIPHVLAAVKTGTLEWPLQFGEQSQITRSHVWRVGSLVNNWNATFGQETLDQVYEWAGALSWCYCQLHGTHRSGLLRWTASRRWWMTSR